ncbi:MAG: exodeoxyribonuclease VII large subunit [Bacteroidetes bacterium]|nr:exodeoxyribonuclease VII large subunit [Bacteroidota bacterium]
MSEHSDNNNFLSLHQLSMHIKDAIEGNFMGQIWVVAEIAAMNVNQGSGHCYLELVEKNEKSVLAKMRANIWSFKLQNILNKFFQVTGSPLQQGMKTLLLVEVQYHAVYGISLNILGVDPSYSLGELARKKREIVDRFEQEGLMDKNKLLEFPLVPQRIALISSETAAGYEDFVNQLSNNSYGYYLDLKIFPAVMQGDKTVGSILSALEKISAKAQMFDTVVIARGGGSTVELSAFDSYELGKAIALFPLPVLTGIGHERDESVADMVAHKKLKTPTAVAEFLISCFVIFEEMLIDAKFRVKELLQEKLLFENTRIKDASNIISRKSMSFVNDRKLELVSLSRDLQEGSAKYLEKKKRVLTDRQQSITVETSRLLKESEYQLKAIKQEVISRSSVFLQQKQNKILLIGEKVKLLDPANVIARGYTLTFSNGKVVKSIADVKVGDELTTQFKDGKTQSKIIEI